MTLARPTIADLKRRFDLNDAQAAFVLYYTGGETAGNGTASYMKAYPTTVEKTAVVNASKLLRKPNLQAARDWCQQSVAQRCGLDAERVLTEIKNLGLSSMADFAAWGDGWVKLHESETIPRELTGLVQEVKQTKDGVQIKLHHKTRALEMLAKHLGLVVDRMDVTSGGEPIATGVLIVPERKTLEEWQAEQGDAVDTAASEA